MTAPPSSLKPLLAITALLVPDMLPAQSWVLQVEPFAGAYSPLTDLEGFVPVDDRFQEFRIDPQPGLAAGARATLWLAGALGFEGGFTYAMHEVKRSFAADTTTASARTWLGSGRVVLRFGAQGGPIAFQVAGGLAYAGRGGDGYRGVRSKETFGGVVGAGAQFDIGEMLDLRFDAESYFYELEVRVRDPAFGDLGLTEQFQSDLVLTVGLNLTLRG